MTKSKAPFVFIIILAILTICSAVWFIIEYRIHQSKHHAYTVEESNLLALQAQLARVEADSKNKVSNPLATKTAPKGANQSGLIREINQSATETGVQVQSLAFTTDATHAEASAGNASSKTTNAISAGSTPIGMKPLNLDIQASGTSAQLLNFVNKIQSNNRLSILQSFSISAVQDGHSLQIEFNFPYLS